MPVPKRKRSKQRRDKRAANWGLKPAIIVGCQTCQAPVLPHQVCKECGYYKGSKVIRTKSDRMQVRSEKFKAAQAKMQTYETQAESAQE